MKAFKGFNKDLTCRGFQYEEGKDFHTERAGSWLELRWYRLTVKRLRLIYTIDVLMEK